MKTKFLKDITKRNSLFFKRIILIFITVISFLSCCNNDEQPFIPNSIQYEIIGTGKLTGAGSEDILPGNFVINNQNDWVLLINKLNSINPDTTNSFSTNNINFQTHLIIAVFDEIRPNLNWDINISNITENSENVIVNVVVINEGNAIQNVIRQPFKIVRIPITTKPILFE